MSSPRMPMSPPRMVSELTPSGRGAITVLQLHAQDVWEQIHPFFKPQANRAESLCPQGVPLYGSWQAPAALSSTNNAEEDSHVEDVIVILRDAENLEIHCHGGSFAKRRILGHLQSQAFEVVPASQLTPSMGPAAAAWQHLPEALTRKSAAVLLRQAEGRLDESIRQLITHIREGSLDAAQAQLQTLLQWANFGQHLLTPWQIVLVGPPNVGKSSLLNRLLGFERAIVYDQPGTTRDVLSTQTAIQGWPVEITDMAGLRTGQDPLEQAGIERALDHLQTADLILQVHEPDSLSNSANPPLPLPLSEDDSRPILAVLNKSDLLSPESREALEEDWLLVSAKTEAGMEDLINAIGSKLVPVEPADDEAIPFLKTHTDTLEQASRYLATANHQNALQTLQQFFPEEA